MGRPALKLTGKIFGSLSITGNCSNRSYWTASCNLCSQEREYRASDLNRGRVNCSCKDGRKTHGMTGNLTYQRWESMKQRAKRHGFTVHPRWLDSYETFLQDRGECPGKEFTLDRIITHDPRIEYDYCPQNTRWACKLQQTANRKSTRIRRVYQGKIQRSGSIGEWARFLGETSGRNAIWTTEYLEIVLRGMTLAEIVQGFFPNLLWLTPAPIINYLESDRNFLKAKFDAEMAHSNAQPDDDAEE